MARVRTNVLLQGGRGQIGEGLVLRRARSGTLVLGRKPTFGKNRIFTPAQRAHPARFPAATAYAKEAALREPIYARLAKKTKQPAYNMALKDYMHPPKVTAIEVRGDAGQARKVIYVQAEDDVQVVRVRVTLFNAQEKVLESGEAASDKAGWWAYSIQTTTKDKAVKIEARAWDLAGNKGRLAVEG